MKKKYFPMKKKSTRNSKKYKSGENEVWLFKDLGIYNSNPEKDKKINDELKSFLKSIGYKPARIKIVEENINTK